MVHWPILRLVCLFTYQQHPILSCLLRTLRTDLFPYESLIENSLVVKQERVLHIFSTDKGSWVKKISYLLTMPCAICGILSRTPVPWRVFFIACSFVTFDVHGIFSNRIYFFKSLSASSFRYTPSSNTSSFPESWRLINSWVVNLCFYCWWFWSY